MPFLIRKRLASGLPFALSFCLFVAALRADSITCATCHVEEGRAQPETAMAHAMELPPHQTILRDHPFLRFQKAGYTWIIERHGDQSTYRVSDGANEIAVPIRYAFGAHSATFVLDYQGALYESRVSYYQTINGLEITPGDDVVVPRTLVEALGRRMPNEEIVVCFNCHGFAPVFEGRVDLPSLTPGVQCDHCHADAQTHMRNIVRGITTSIPEPLEHKSAEDTSDFCGSCHRSWQQGMQMALTSKGFWGPANVRFHPYRLANSRCFDGTDNRIRCTACHNPHQPLVRDAASYDRNCLACHGPNGSSAAAPGREVPRSCPVSTKGCVSCHMLRVKMPDSPLVFTDHQIRIAKRGDPYPN